MRKPRAVLFDWDNTLVESWDIIHESLRLTFLDLGHEPWTFEQTKSWVRRSMRDSFPDLFGADAARAERLFYQHYREHHLHRLTPLVGAKETLDALHNDGLPLGVVSSKQGDLVREEAARLGWGGYFGRIVGANDGPADKPAPDAVIRALDGTGISPGLDVWYVGDTGIDVTCARNAGCTAVIVSAAPRRRLPARAGSSILRSRGVAWLLAGEGNHHIVDTGMLAWVCPAPGPSQAGAGKDRGTHDWQGIPQSPGRLPQSRAQRENAGHDLSRERRQAPGNHHLVR